MQEFEHFAENSTFQVWFLKWTCHRRLGGHDPINEHLTAGNKAFGVITLDNKLCVWDQQMKMQKEQSKDGKETHRGQWKQQRRWAWMASWRTQDPKDPDWHD